MQNFGELALEIHLFENDLQKSEEKERKRFIKASKWFIKLMHAIHPQCNLKIS